MSRISDLSNVTRPLTPTQRVFWGMQPVPTVWKRSRFDGTLQRDHLLHSLNNLVARHDSLRGAFTEGPAGALWRIRPEAEVAFEAFATPDQTQAVSTYPFSLESGPLLWATAVEDGDGFFLMLAAPRIVCDTRSLDVLLAECQTLYAAAVAGAEATLPPARSYIDVPGVATSPEEAASLILPAADSLAHLTRVLSADLSESIGALAQTQGATPGAVVLAAFQVLLGRYSNTEEFVLQLGTDGRPEPELAELVGPLATTLPLRADLTGSPSFGALVGRSSSTAEGQDGALLSAAFGLGEEPATDCQVALTFTKGALVWTGRVAAEALARMAGHLETLLTAAVQNPAAPIATLPLLTEAEVAELVAWNDQSRAPYPADKTVHELIEAQVERTPDAIALHVGEVRLTYRALNERANQVAHYLRARGIGPDDLVGIYMERSVELIIGLLGVLKAGGAYVPLDPAYPQDRLAFMVSDSQVKALLTVDAMKGGLPTGEAAVVCLDTDWTAIAGHPVTNPSSGVGPTNLIYVIYTSGSTGKPKGVLLTHRGVVNHNTAAVRLFGLQPADRVLQSASISFDISVEEIFPTLMTGATLVLLPFAKLPSIPEFQRVLTAEAISFVDLPTAYWHEWVAELARTGEPVPASVRQVAVGGEKASAERLAQWQQVTGGQVAWINTYGPTETTIISTTYTVPAGAGAIPAEIPIGRPIANTQIWLLDRSMQPVPVGVPGEMYIGGDGLARGYLGRPDLSAERFVESAFGRLYRTGDLARLLPTGELEFVGRADFQVKIRGFRVELGEIESALQLHPAVRDVIVLAPETEAGHKRLVAYLVPHAGAALDRNAVRQFLRQELPEYMVPAAFVLLERLPLSPNGKVDRKALPIPAAGDFATDEAFVAPRTPAETRLASLWGQVLGMDQVSVTASFFDLGGHSLLATQLLSRVRDAFGVELPLRAVFETPTVAGLAVAIAAAGQREPVAPLAPLPRSGELALSHAQQRLWFVDQLDGGAAYHIVEAVTLSGALDLVALRRSLNEIVRRHEALRTTFQAVDGRPVQVIAPTVTLELPVVELAREQVQTYMSTEAQRPFRLSEGPLVRAVLLRLSETEHVLLVVMHHIVSDGWSSGVLLTELSALYEGQELPPLPIQYADYAAWQRQWLQGEVLQRQLGYWAEQLAGAPPVLELPTDRPRPAIATTNGATQRVVLDRSLADALNALSRREGVTLFMTLLAAFQTLLHRYSGQSDIAVGTPVANRNRAELEQMIGFFVNTLVMRTDLSGSPSEGDLLRGSTRRVLGDRPPTFRELLRRVREVALGAYGHQDAPFDQIVEAVRPERSLSYHPLFQVMFVLQNAPAPRSTTGLSVNRLEVQTGAAAFDLTLTMEETEQGLIGDLEYNTDLFDATTITRMLGHFRTLLEAIVADPAQPVGRLALITPAEREQVLVEWNRTGAPLPGDLCLHDLFEAQAEQHPDLVALQFGAETMTYAELNARANQLARHLRGQGVGPDVPVGLFIERSMDLIVAILGVLKAGGAYLPLDPTYPAERLAYMLADSAAPVVLTQQRLLAPLQSLGFEGATLSLDADWSSVAAHESTNLPALARPEHLVYTMYTSGSTGKPKGVQVEHRNLVAYVLAAGSENEMRPGQRMLQFATINFDTAVEEIFVTLTHGGTLVLRTDSVLAAMDQFLAQVAAWEINILDLPTAYWHEMALQIAEHGYRLPASVRRVIIGGEAALPERVALWLKHVGTDVALVNTYGPTEATVIATSCVVQPGPDGVWVPSIGRPLANYQVYLLDDHCQPVPVGVPGELYIGGPSVARGYLNRPDQTAERFLTTELGRVYRTGDLARYLPDGQIQFVGRVDDQVKIRGFRVELGEIESVLLQHEGVRDAVVVARQDQPGTQKRLVAYVVAAGDVTQVKSYLKERLPEYMIPSVFVTLEALPLMPNGKVNRRALPAPDLSQLADGKAYVAPRTPAEATLAQVWAQVLGLERVSVTDNFFALGGDSILSLQVVAKAARAGLQLTPKQLFQYQTVAGQAAVAGTARTVEAEQGAVVGELPLTPIQHWFFAAEFPEQHHWNQEFLLEVRPDVDPDLLEQAVGALLAHHDALRARYHQTEAGDWVQTFVAPGGPVPFERIEGPFNEATCAKLQASLNLEEGPLLRAGYFHGGARLFLTVHHLVVDGVSWRVLLEDLETAYEQLRRGEPVKLPPKSTSFKQWAERLAAYGAQSGALRQESAYWLADERRQAPALPVDFPGGEPTLATSRQVVVTLDGAQTRTLLQDLSAAYRTQINDVLLTALAEAAAGWTGDRRLLVNLEGHGRESILDGVDLSRTVGWFTTVFPVLLDLGAPANPGEALKRIKEQLRAVPNRGIGHGLLRYLSGDATVAEQLDALPQPGISFNYLGQFDQVLEEGAPFVPAREATGPAQSLAGRQDALLEVEARVLGGELTLEFHYSENVHRRETVAALAERFVAALRGLIAHCTAPGVGGFTPSDFPHARLTQAQLDQLVARVGRGQLEDLYALSPMQQGMLFETLMAPHSGVYFVQTVYAFTGALDEAAFERAWQQVVERHPILRTGFVWEGVAEPLQVVYRHVNLPLVRRTWNGEADHADFLAQDRTAGFDLSQPAMRLTLVRVAAESYRFVWSIHHALIDGWSSPLILQELFGLYTAFARGEELTLPPGRPFGEYIAWLRQRELSEAESFWRKALAGFTAPTPLVVDAAQPGETGYGELHAQLPVAVLGALQALAQQQQVTLNTVMQGAWALLLSRYSREEDVLFGATVAGRSAALPGIETMVGPFLNTLPVRVQVTPNETIASYLRQLQLQQVEARQYEYTALVDLQGWSEVPRGTRLFESILVFENYPGSDEESLAQAGLQAELASAAEQTNYPLTVIAEPGDGLNLSIAFDRSRFAPAVIERMLGHLQMVLRAIAGRPEQLVAEVALLTETERQQVVVDFNQTDAAYARELCVHELVAGQDPAAVAVVQDGTVLTYGQLNRKANQLARFLRRNGVGHETLVAVLAERSPELIVALLAVLKAGAAYVPIDPEYPAERISYMLADSGAPILLTQSAPAPGTQVGLAGGAQVILLDSTDWANESDEPLPNEFDANSLAYVIYTSGSTGKPKGVAVEHGSLLNLVFWHRNAYGVTAADRATQLAGVAFDASVWEVWPYLTAGASLHLPDAETRLAPAKLADWLVAERINLAFLPTPLAEELLRRDWPAQTALRAMLTGGDQLRSFPTAAHPFTLVNHYGPTESTVVTTAGLAPRDGAGLPTIGRPIANTRVYLLDATLQPVPVGVYGELYIAGAGLARGYLHRPDLTEERFLTTEFGRLYRSGDLARWLDDGQIEFQGRVDHQVKIRGFRIELGEIESVLTQHPAVRDAVVIAREDQPGAKRLVAYVVPEGAPETSELRSFLQQRLPAYMVPAAFVTLEALPLTPNGKVDRRALPAPASEETVEAFVAPRTPTEELVAAIWAQVLGLAQVSADASFFALGGHSLLATQVISRVRETFRVDLPLRALFEAPTVAGLAALVASAVQAAATAESGSAQVAVTAEPGALLERGAQVEPIRPVPRDQQIPVSPAQRRLWFIDQMEPGNTTYNMSLALRLTGSLQIDSLEQAFTALVRRHESLRTTFATVANQPVQVIADPQPFALTVTALGSEAEALAFAASEAQRPFDLARGPLCRAHLLRLGELEHVLVLTMHHIISDGWSMSVLLDELAALYQGAPLPELTLQYADFAHWQRVHLAGGTHLQYWKQQLAGSPALLELPTDRPRPPVQSFRGAAISRTLDADLLGRVKALSRQEGVTLFMALLAAYQTLLARYSGQTDIPVGSPIAGRNRAETEGLVGFFVNTLVLRTDLSGAPTFRDLLRRVREVTLGAYQHQELPFDQVVDALQPERNLSHTPLFQTLFVLQNTPPVQLSLPGLTAAHLEVEDHVAPFDLVLTADETADGLVCELRYATDLFDGATAARMLTHFETLLAAAVADPAQSVGMLPMLTQAERQQLLAHSAPAPGLERCIHEVFEEQVRRTPEAIAVEFGETRLTYAQLNRRANQLAHHLRRLGVGPEVMVGLCADRSIELTVGLLATLKAGGAYVPMDPTYPADRLAYMLADSGVKVLLTMSQSLPPHGATVVRLDADFSAEPATDLAHQTTPANLAYVIYTSGSTGRPKGVLVEHRGLYNLATAQIEAFRVTPQSRVLQFASVSFDASVSECFMAWVAGATLVLEAKENLLPGPGFLQFLRQKRITTVTLPPSLLAVLPSDDLPDLATVITAGEACSAEVVARWAPGRHFVNAYGPTEGTVCATLGACVDTGRPPTIGRPLANVQIYLLDQNLQPRGGASSCGAEDRGVLGTCSLVPVGVPGELHIGGIGLARGYHNRPDLTAEKFIDSPFGLLYKSGDLARWLPSGEIEYLGRLDHQVKIRGFRIEIGEIEAVLAQHPAVSDTVVLARADQPGVKRLVAYVVAKQVEVAQLRAHVAERLPEFMVPAAFVVLDAFPFTPNGKVDRKALPAPDQGRSEAGGRAYVAPRNPKEEALARIWAQVLGREQVSVQANFFELGGDSILSLQIIFRASEAGLKLTPKQLFQHQTVAAQALVAEEVAATETEQGPVTGPLPLTPIQSWFFAQQYPVPQHWNQDDMQVLGAPLDPALAEQAVGALMAHHDMLRARYRLTEEGWLQEIAEDLGAVPFTQIDLSAVPASEQSAVLTATANELQASLNLAEGPLLRVAQFVLGPTQARLLFIIHHLAVDGVSWRILTEDFQTAYGQLKSGQPVQLPRKTTSFKHWSYKLQEYAQGEALQKELPYWLDARRTAVAPLPVDFPGGLHANTSTQTVPLVLSAEETKAILQEVPAAFHAQVNDILLTALAQALQKWTGRNAFLVDLEGHGREEIIPGADLTRTVGWFTSAYPVLLEPGAPTATPGDALKVVKEQLRAVPNKGIGYGLLRYLSGDAATEAQLKALPQAAIAFNYLGQFEQAGAEESTGHAQSLAGTQDHPLLLTGYITGGQLRLTWLYSANIHRRTTIENLSNRYLEALRALIAQCRKGAGGFTPSDFTKAKGLDQNKLDKLMSKIGGKGLKK